MKFAKLKKLKKGDKVAILSPSFAAPGKWPHVHELGLKRLRDVFGLVPVEFPTTRKLGASKEERAADLIAAFKDKTIKGIITTLGGNDQVTYIKTLPSKPFRENPKPFLGYSDNTHFMNFLWLNKVPSYYGGALFTQFAKEKEMDEFTISHLKNALFENKKVEIKPSEVYNDVAIGAGWNDPNTLTRKRVYEKNSGWFWNGEKNVEGITWGGCVESVDEILRHGIKIPSLKDFESVILIMETSEEIPSADYVYRVYRALGERGILGKIRGVLVGRPKAWEFDKQWDAVQKEEYRAAQRKVTLDVIRKYNKLVPVIQNVDFGHTDPQVPFPFGQKVKLDSKNKKIFVQF